MTVISVSGPTRTMLTSALAPGPACLRTLVSASWITRYAARSTAAGSGARSVRASSTGESGATEPGQQIVQDGEAGGGFGGGRRVAGLAQQADGGAQFVQRRAAGLPHMG